MSLPRNNASSQLALRSDPDEEKESVEDAVGKDSVITGIVITDDCHVWTAGYDGFIELEIRFGAKSCTKVPRLPNFSPFGRSELDCIEADVGGGGPFVASRGLCERRWIFLPSRF